MVAPALASAATTPGARRLELTPATPLVARLTGTRGAARAATPAASTKYIHAEVTFVLTMAAIAVLLVMNLAGVLLMDILLLQIRLEHLGGLIAYRVSVNLQSINAALTITVLLASR